METDRPGGKREARQWRDACSRIARRFVMRYIVAWLLGVPFSVIVLWYLVGHAACR